MILLVTIGADRVATFFALEESARNCTVFVGTAVSLYIAPKGKLSFSRRSCFLLLFICCWYRKVSYLITCATVLRLVK